MEKLFELLEDYAIFKLDEKGNILYSNLKNFGNLIGEPFIEIVSEEDRKKTAKLFLNAIKKEFAEDKIRIKLDEIFKIFSIKLIKDEKNFYVLAKEIKEEKPSFICDFLGNVIYATDEWKVLEEKNIFDQVEDKKKLYEIIEKTIERGEYECKIFINEIETKARIKAHQHLEFFIEEDIGDILEDVFYGKDINDVFEKANRVLKKMNVSYFFSLFDKRYGKRKEEKYEFYIWLDGEEIGKIIVNDEIDEWKRYLIKFISTSISQAIKSLRSYDFILKNFAIYKVDDEGKILFANEEFSKITGYKLEEIIGKNVKEIAERREEFFKEIVKGKLENFISKWKGKNKSIFVNENAWKVNGEIVSVIEDITVEVEKEKENEFYNSLLRHDIYNKNEIAIGFLSLLDKTKLTKKQREYINKIRKAIEEANKLIENVRKAEELRKKNKELISINLKEIVEKIYKSFEEIAKEKEIKISLHIDDVFVAGDEFIGEIFKNLIRNAIEHSNCKNIEIRGRKIDGNYLVCIEDDGKGIDEKDIEKIFERGWKKDSKGSGLGLYIVKKLMERYNGKVYVESEKGKGTKFYLNFNIPRKRDISQFLKIRF